MILLLLLLAGCEFEPPDSAPQSEYEEHVSKQSQRWQYRVQQRGEDPGIRPQFVDADSLDWVGTYGIGSRWAGFKFRANRDDGYTTYIIEEDTAGTIRLPWQNIGANASGRILAHAFHPDNPRTIWVGSASGGLWKTTDAGESWQAVTTHLPSMVVSAVAVHPTQPDTLLIGTMNDFGDGDHIQERQGLARQYGYGVFRTEDGGRTWHTTQTSFSDEGMDSNQLIWDQAHPNQVFLAASNGVWRSEDAGKSWELLLAGNAKSISYNESRSDVLYAALAPSRTETDSVAGVWRSTDQGVSWSRLDEGLPAPGDYTRSCGICTYLSFSEGFPDIGYASIQLDTVDALYRTRDGGEHWERLPTQMRGQGMNLWKAHVSPVDSNLVFAGGVNLYRTGDGGQTWSQVGGLRERDSLYVHDIREARLIHVDQQDFAFDPIHPDTVYAFNDGGVYISTDGGQRWAVRNRGLMTLQLYSLGIADSDAGRVAAGAQDQGQLFLDAGSGGGTWRKINTGDGMVTLIDPEDPDLIYTTSQFGEHWQVELQELEGRLVVSLQQMQTGIDGSNLDDLSNTNFWVTPKVMDPDDPTRLYTATFDSVYRTEGQRGALTWRAMTAIDSVSVLRVHRHDPDTTAIVYAYSDKRAEPALWHSLDDGETWTRMAYASDADWPHDHITRLVADPDWSGVLYAVRSAYSNQVWRSVDSARTWVDITNNLSEAGGGVPVNAVAITADSVASPKQVYLATDNGVFRAVVEDAAQDLAWQRVRGLPNVIVNDIHIHPLDGSLRVGTYGRGYWQAPLPP